MRVGRRSRTAGPLVSMAADSNSSLFSLSLHSLFLFDSSFQVTVPIVSNEKCKDMFLKAGRQEYIPDIFMCAGFEEGGRDSCQVFQNLQTFLNPQYSFKSLDPTMSKHDQIRFQNYLCFTGRFGRSTTNPWQGRQIFPGWHHQLGHRMC